MKRIIVFIYIFVFTFVFSNNLYSQMFPTKPLSTLSPSAVNPPPPRIIRQDFYIGGTKINLGQLPLDGINLSADMNAMAEDSFIEIKRLDSNATISEIVLNCNRKRFIPVSDLYEIKTKNKEQFAALPIKYAIMANGDVPNGSRLFVLVKLGSEVYFIPANTTTTYGMVIAEINSCAIYDKIALIADTSYGINYIKSFMLSASLDSNNKPANPHYAELSDDDGFAISAHVFPEYGKSKDFSLPTMTIIQPKTSNSINLYKIEEKENVFVQSLPFTTDNSYSFCKIDLKNFEKYYDSYSLSYAIWFGFLDTNIEDIPRALIFRATCYDSEGVKYSTEDQLVYLAASLNGYKSPFSAGNGTCSDPYIINTVGQLDKVRDYKRRYFKLGSDLDLKSYQYRNWLSLGDNEEPFNGYFDGNNKTIYNLYINEPYENYQGLFGCIRNGSVRNLKVELSPEGIVCDTYCGALAGYCANARIYQCYSTGSIKANNYIGSLIGYTTNNTVIRKSISDFTIGSDIANITIGGLVGYAENTTITDCLVNTEITVSGLKSSIGGIIGQGEKLKLQNSYATGFLKAGKTSYAGGLVGYTNNSEIKGCIALNSSIAAEFQGRISGKAKNTAFIRCFAWDQIKDIDNEKISEGGFGGRNATKEGMNGESIGKGSFYGAKTRNKFWTLNKKIGFNLNSWVFNSGYNLPQLRSMPSLSDPDYLK